MDFFSDEKEGFKWGMRIGFWWVILTEILLYFAYLESKKILYNMFDSIIELNKNSSNNKNLTINKNDFVDKMMFIYNKCLSKLDKIKFLFVQKDLDKAIKESNKCIFPYNVKPLLVNNKFKKKIPYIKNSSSVFKYKTDSSQIARKKDNKFTSIYC